MAHRILIVDDDADFSFLLANQFTAKGFEVFTAASGQEALRRVEEVHPHLVLLDMALPDKLGSDLIAEIKEKQEGISVIMISGFGDSRHVVQAIQSGASDYVQKPVEFHDLFEKVNRLFLSYGAGETEGAEGGEIFLGKSPEAKRLLREIEKVAPSDAPVLLRGESGVGKTQLAEMIHAKSRRKDNLFVTINCPAIPESLLESELFGHEKGAFTGAVREKIGKFEFADRGSIFLDEIGDLSQELQAKILRVLQSHEFERVGGLKTIRVDVRIIAATNKDLEQAIQKRNFREDLFYRLNVLPIYIPPLRNRKEDIPLLAEYFLKIYSQKSHKHFEPLSPGLCQHLIDYNWPGNVRELQNVIERAVVLGRAPKLKPSDFVFSNPLSTRPAESPPSLGSLRDLEQGALVRALEDSGGNISRAAQILGVARDTVYRRLKKYKIGLK